MFPAFDRLSVIIFEQKTNNLCKLFWVFIVKLVFFFVSIPFLCGTLLGMFGVALLVNTITTIMFVVGFAIFVAAQVFVVILFKEPGTVHEWANKNFGKSIVYNRYRAFKEKTCPLITYVDKPKELGADERGFARSVFK